MTDLHKKLGNSWQIYKDGSRDDGFIQLREAADICDYIYSKIGQHVRVINEIHIGKTYPYNNSNPYSHDEYEVTLDDETTFRIERSYGQPRWSGNVSHCEYISVK